MNAQQQRKKRFKNKNKLGGGKVPKWNGKKKKKMKSKTQTNNEKQPTVNVQGGGKEWNIKRDGHKWESDRAWWNANGLWNGKSIWPLGLRMGLQLIQLQPLARPFSSEQFRVEASRWIRVYLFCSQFSGWYKKLSTVYGSQWLIILGLPTSEIVKSFITIEEVWLNSRLYREFVDFVAWSDLIGYVSISWCICDVYA